MQKNNNILVLAKQHNFLFEQLVIRDFKKKYKGTALGILWSVLAPLLQLIVMALVFSRFFGQRTPHYIIYLFSGNLLFSFFKESTTGGMVSLVANAAIITKISVPKYIFLLSKNVSSLINFSITLIIYFVFVFVEGVPITSAFFMIFYPIICLGVFNIGIGMVLSALFVFFKDIQYLYEIFTMLLLYVSAIFYTIDVFPPNIQSLFYINPIYVYIDYVRTIILNGSIPSVTSHLLCVGYALIALTIGYIVYKRNNYKFIYYM